MTTQKVPGKILPWSYSSLQAYETCPKRFYLQRIAKVVTEAPSAAADFGQRVHKSLEDYVGSGVPLPVTLQQYQPLADKIKATPGEKLVEKKFALTAGLKPVDFWDSTAWVRGLLDVIIVRPTKVIVLDYKTGKRKLDSDQLKLFAAAALTLYPNATAVDTGYLWLPIKQLDKEAFKQGDQTVIFQDFARRVHRMEKSLENDSWEAKPSGLCKAWCPVGKKLCNHCGT